MRNNLNFSNKSFTLIEILIVIAILGLLASIVVVSVNDVRDKGRDAKRKAEADGIEKALVLYYYDNNKYPIVSEFVSLENNPATDEGDFDTVIKPYLASTPRNPLRGVI